MARPRYLLHIGPPKTGTKSIQHALRGLRPRLRADGVEYPDVWWSSPDHFSHEALVLALMRGPGRALEECFATLNASPQPTILLSCEGFVDLPAEQLAYLHQLTGGAPTRVVYYARRWSDWLPSSWQEMVRQGSTLSFPEMLARLLRAPVNEQAINANLILDRFAAVFGADSIVLGSYSNIVDAGGDILQDFLRNVLQLDYPDAAAERSVNPSMDPCTTELVRALNALEKGAAQPRPHFEHALSAIDSDSPQQADLELLHARMREHLCTLPLSDDCAALRPIWLAIGEKYGSCLVGREHGAQIFTRRARAIPYVGADYLLDAGVVTALNRLHRATGGWRAC